MIQHEATAALPTEFGLFELHLFTQTHTAAEIMVLTQLKQLKAKPLVRVHSSCATGDIFRSTKCDCGAQLHAALHSIQAEGGILLYLPQEGRGIGLTNKIKAYALQDSEHLDTVDANLRLGLPIDARSYEDAISILQHFKLKEFVLLSNNPKKIAAFQNQGSFTVTARPLITLPTPENAFYLQTKTSKLGHLL